MTVMNGSILNKPIKIKTKYSDLTHQQKKRKHISNQSYRTRKKEWMVAYMGGCCVRCGYNKCIAALELHHLDPTTKEFSWTELRKQAKAAILRELAKCILVCANCHREIHWEINNPPVNTLSKFIET